MGKITVAFDKDDWVWLCDFLVTVIKEETRLKPYEREDLAHITNLLYDAEKGLVL